MYPAEDLDWAGQSDRARGKKMQPRAPSHLTASTEYGMTPSSEAAVVDQWKPEKRVVEHRNRAAREEGVAFFAGSGEDASGEPASSPSVFVGETEYQRAVRHEGTPLDVRTDKARALYIPGRRMVKPASELAVAATQRACEGDRGNWRAHAGLQSVASSSSFIGTSPAPAPASGGPLPAKFLTGRSSFLGGMGKLVVQGGTAATTPVASAAATPASVGGGARQQGGVRQEEEQRQGYKIAHLAPSCPGLGGPASVR